jgi:hypothetical protein
MTHDGAAVKARNRKTEQETEQEPGLIPTYPIGLPSTIDPVSQGPGFTPLTGGFSGPLFWRLPLII